MADLDATVAARPPRRDDGGPTFLGKLARYFHLAFRVTYEDGVLLTASALAFVTVLSLIPLLTALSFVGARVFSQYPQRSLEVFVQILPYSDKSVVDAIAEFLDQAATIHGVGVIAFFATTLYLFATVEETFNKIWNVSRRRPIRARLISFVLLIFWGPLLVGATFSSLIVLRQSPALRRLFQESFLLNALPFAATVLGLTMLYWKVPHTQVRLRNALAGGLLTGILLEILREGFGSYVEVFRNVSIVYGSYAFALLFMISIDLTWTIILFGAVATYTAQHFSLLARGLHRHPPVQAAWVGLAALALIARRFNRGEPPLSREALADRMCLPTTELERILRPISVQGLLQVVGDHGYALAADPQRIRVEEVLAAYDHRARRGAELVGGEIAARLEQEIDELARVRAGTLGDVTVADLLEAGDSAALPSPTPPGTMSPSRTVGQ
jgi:membrane protein